MALADHSWPSPQRALASAYWHGDRGPVAELWELLIVPPATVSELVEPLVQ